MAAAAGAKAPSPRSVAASLARALSLVAPAAADAVLCLCIAEIWLLFAGAFAVGIARVTGTEDRAVAVAASKLVAFCDSYLVPALVQGAIIFVWRLEKDDADEELKQLARWVVRRRGPAPNRLAAGCREVRCRTVVFGMYACAAFFLLMAVGDDLMRGGLPIMGYPREAIGFAVRAVGHLGKNASSCFIVVPTAALKVWRVTRPGWRSAKANSKFSISWHESPITGSTLAKNP